MLGWGLEWSGGTTVGAFEELARTGAVGDQTVALLRQLGKQFTRTHSFPPPREHKRWSDDAVDDLLASMLATKGSAFVLSCYLKATDQGSLERLIECRQVFWPHCLHEFWPREEAVADRIWGQRGSRELWPGPGGGGRG